MEKIAACYSHCWVYLVLAKVLYFLNILTELASFMGYLCLKKQRQLRSVVHAASLV